MLNITRVMELFGFFTDLPSQQLEKWGYLCDNSAQLLASKLRENVSVPANMERLCTTAAAFAYADYLLLSGVSGSNADEFRVGDIAVKNSSSSNSNQLDSESVRDYFLEQISDLILPAAFAFVTVEAGSKL